MLNEKPERRRLRRHIQRIPARFQSGSMQGQGYLCNLSKEGLFLRADRLPTPRAQVFIIIEPADGHKVELTGSVMWTTAELEDPTQTEPGFGVRVEGGSQDFRAFFQSLLIG